MRLDDDALARLHNTITYLYPNVYSLIILKDGAIVFEKYYRNALRDDARDVASVAKSIVSALMGIAIQQGYIKNEDMRVLDFFPHCLDAESDPNILKVRIKHILTMTSGLYYLRLAADSQPVVRRRNESADWVKYMLGLPVKHPDGKTFCYSNFDADLCAAVIQKAVPVDLYDFADTYLFSKIGIKVPRWEYSDPGNLIPARICMTARDMAGFGQLYLQNGMWNGKEVICKEWVQKSHKNYGTNYGYLWWLEGNTYFASGAGGSVIWVIPEEGVVVASQAKILKTNWNSPVKAVKEILSE